MSAAHEISMWPDKWPNFLEIDDVVELHYEQGRWIVEVWRGKFLLQVTQEEQTAIAEHLFGIREEH